MALSTSLSEFSLKVFIIFPSEGLKLLIAIPEAVTKSLLI
jgi:hypothetical protein